MVPVLDGCLSQNVILHTSRREYLRHPPEHNYNKQTLKEVRDEELQLTLFEVLYCQLILISVWQETAEAREIFGRGDEDWAKFSPRILLSFHVAGDRQQARPTFVNFSLRILITEHVTSRECRDSCSSHTTVQLHSCYHMYYVAPKVITRSVITQHITFSIRTVCSYLEICMHPALVLRPGCAPEWVGVNQNGVGQPKGVKQKWESTNIEVL
jgi:hypothetical protein